MNSALLILNIALVGSFGFFSLRALARRWIGPRHGLPSDEPSSKPDFSVEVDCRACGQFNRVPSHRLRDRPTCGHCKARLMPGRRVNLCRVSNMSASLSAALDATWRDEDRLWQCLADHVAQEDKAPTEARNARPWGAS